MMNPEELFEKLMDNEITREEFEKLLEGLDDDAIRARYDRILQARFMEEVDRQFENPKKAHHSKKSLHRVRYPKDIRGMRRRQYPVAAIILALVGVAFSILFVITEFKDAESSGTASLDGQEQLITKSTPNRRMFRMRLQDGTFVHLNAVSSITYPREFGDDKRVISVSGEAYFDVKHEEARPFNIKVNDYTVRVLGTSFNIQAHEDEAEFSVVVESGTVSVDLASGEKNPVILTRNEKLTYSTESGAFKVMKIDSEEELSWRKGILRFNSTPMTKVEKMLERWYGYEIIIEDDEIYNNSFTGTHQNKTIKSVLESVTFATNSEYLIKDDSIIIKY
jgi:ferric-dicitrate binding protein FerR (iron transport regulator)